MCFIFPCQPRHPSPGDKPSPIVKPFVQRHLVPAFIFVFIFALHSSQIHHKMIHQDNIKTVVVGDGAVGKVKTCFPTPFNFLLTTPPQHLKTCLLISYTTVRFPLVHNPKYLTKASEIFSSLTLPPECFPSAAGLLDTILCCCLLITSPLSVLHSE